VGHTVLGAVRDDGLWDLWHRKAVSARLTYRYTHAFWVFGKSRERHYEWVCSGCKAVIPADPGQIAGRLTSNPIPFLRRWGWLVYAGGGAMFILYMMWNLVMNTP
jgi:hypothetical protein